jgi:hypothetical protein
MNIESRLRERFEAAGEQMPGGRLSFQDTLARARRDRRRYRFAVAIAGAAAAVGVAVGIAALTGPERQSPIPPVVPPVESPTPSPDRTPSRPIEELYDDGLPEDFRAEPVLRVIDDFLAAAEASDAEALWSLMSDEARARFDDFDAFAEFAVQINGETMGAWARVTDPEIAFYGIELPGEETGIITTMFGEVTQEGPTRSSFISIPVRLGGSGNNATATVDAFTMGEFETTAISGGNRRLLDLGRLTRVGSRTDYRVATSGQPTAARIDLVYEFSEPALPVLPGPTQLEYTDTGAVASWEPDGVGVQGDFALVAAFVAEDGAIEVQAYPVRVGR